MSLYKARGPIDYSLYANESGPYEVKYGLPGQVRFCKRCVISNQRPSSTVEYQHTRDSKKVTIVFDEEGVCDACRFAEKKRQAIDWEDKEQRLRELCNRHRSSDGSWDCIFSGSGGKDSFYAAHVLKYKYGMNPLTVTWAPHIYTDWGWKNFQAWIHAGFDNLLFTPNGKVHRLLTRLSVENLFHPFQPFIIGQKALAPKMAAKFNIKLIFFGENEAEYGNPIRDNQSAKRDWSYFTASDRSAIYLGGTSLFDLGKYFDVGANELQSYLPVDPDIIEKKQIEVHYLGYYLKWHPQRCYFFAVENGGFRPSPERTAGTFSKYSSIDDKLDDLHYYTTYIKFGIGRATYDAAQEIRSGDLTREEGVALVKRYDGEFPERFIEEIFQYLSIPPKEFPKASQMFEQTNIDRDYFSHLEDRFRSPHLWRYDHGRWNLRHRVWDEPGSIKINQEDEALTWEGNKYRPFWQDGS
jgi:N-acetyl sugar amidotransferase